MGYMNVKLPGLILFSLFLFASQVQAQFLFERAETSAGELRLAISNIGTLGKPDVRNNPDAGASMRFPANTGTEHLFEAGIWIGAFAGGQQLTSTSAITDPGGFASGKRGFEFTADGQIRFEGENTGVGISQQDIITNFTDRNTVIPGTNTVIQGHDQPLFADVELRSLNWDFPFTENFTILQYDITNNSQIHSGNPDGVVWDSVYVGMYADLVARNVFTATDQGSAFFNKNGIGFLDDLFTTYVFDAGSTDMPSINTYGAVSLIGSEYRGEFFHPFNDQLPGFGLRTPDVGPSYWLFSAGTGVFLRPSDDIERYNRMAETFPIDTQRPGSDKPSIREELRTDGQESEGNYISFISTGPFTEVLPGETITIFFGVSAALKPEQFQGLAGKSVDNEESRVNLVSTINSLNRVFQGEDVNNNGRLDPGEDLNDNGQLDRFLFPTPPDNPNVRIELEAGSATIFWDRLAEESVDPITGETDFEGYRIYRSDLGDDINPNPRLIREFDNTGNDVGFNTGFEEVRLEEPVTFPDDTVQYWHKFEVDGLLSGWQYQFSVTSFDFGSEQFEIGPLESSRSTNAVRVFPGTTVNTNFGSDDEENRVGVYPNPYRVNAAWDGTTEQTRKLVFFNLPSRAQIRVYTLAGDIVARMDHRSDDNRGDIQWFNEFSSEPRIIAGGEHAWDILSDANQILTTGLYLYSVKDLDSGRIQTGKIAIIK